MSGECEPGAVALAAIRRLFEYNSQATRRLLTVAGELAVADLTAPVVDGYPSIRDTFVHMADTQTCHVAWISGAMTRDESFARQFPVDDYPDIDAVSAFWKTVDKEASTFVASLAQDSDLARVYSRTRPDGPVVKRTLWEVMLHIVNHGTQHRSEIALMLTALGHSPGDLDLL